MKKLVGNMMLVICLMSLSCSEADGGENRFKERMAGSAEFVNGILYVMGGMSLSSNLDSVGAYNPSTQTWTAKASIPIPESLGSSVVFGNNIYMIGGRNENSVLSSVQKYSTVDDKWITCSKMPTARWSLMTCTAGDMIYAFGGISGLGNNRQALDTIEAYDPNDDQWKHIGKMPEPRQGAAIAGIEDTIYVISGKIASYVERTSGDQITSNVNCFNIKTKEWKKIQDIPTGRTGAKAIVAYDQIFIVGGVSRDGGFPTQIDIFNPRTNKWTAGPQLSLGRSGHMCTFIDGFIYVLGGTSKSYGSSKITLSNSIDKISISEYAKSNL